MGKGIENIQIEYPQCPLIFLLVTVSLLELNRVL